MRHCICNETQLSSIVVVGPGQEGRAHCVRAAAAHCTAGRWPCQHSPPLSQSVREEGLLFRASPSPTVRSTKEERERADDADGRSIDQDRLTHPLHALLGGLASELLDSPKVFFSQLPPMGETDRRRPFQLHIK